MFGETKSDGIQKIRGSKSRLLRYSRKPHAALFAIIIIGLFFYRSDTILHLQQNEIHIIPEHLKQAQARCAQLKLSPGPSPDFTHERTVSDRFVLGTPATLVKNATIWTGRADGSEVIRGDVLLDKGLIKGIGKVELGDTQVVEIDARGAWVTSG